MLDPSRSPRQDVADAASAGMRASLDQVANAEAKAGKAGATGVAGVREVRGRAGIRGRDVDHGDLGPSHRRRAAYRAGDEAPDAAALVEVLRGLLHRAVGHSPQQEAVGADRLRGQVGEGAEARDAPTGSSPAASGCSSLHLQGVAVDLAAEAAEPSPHPARRPP